MNVRPAFVALVAAVALGPSCATKNVTFSLDVPSSIAQDVAWFEIGAYANATCPSDAELAGGVPEGGAAAYVTFSATSPVTPTVGDLPRGTYAFAAVARQADCSVIAVGCETVDVSSTSDVEVQLAATSDPAGACESGAVCDDARCVAASNIGDPTTGAGCSLQLVGAGPLGDPLSSTSTLLSSPVIVSTGDGFLIAYREFDPSTATARLTVIPIDEGGGAGAIQTDDKIPGCSGISDPDATGFAFGTTGALVALARPQCSGEPMAVGVDFISIDPLGNIGSSLFKAVPGSSVSLAPARALAATPDGYLLAMTIGNQAAASNVVGMDLSGDTVAFGGATPMSDAWAAASNDGIALLALGTAPAGDGGNSPDTGLPGASLRLITDPDGSLSGMLPDPTEFPGKWGSLSMVGTRVIVVSDGVTSGQPVAWYAFDVGNPQAVAQGSFALSVLGEAVYADVVTNQDHAFIAVEVAGMTGTISLAALDHVSTTPVYLAQVPFSGLPTIPIGNLRDGLVSVTASDARVAVVWGTAKTLGMNDNVGGYAVFACTP